MASQVRMNPYCSTVRIPEGGLLLAKISDCGVLDSTSKREATESGTCGMIDTGRSGDNSGSRRDTRSSAEPDNCGMVDTGRSGDIGSVTSIGEIFSSA